MTRRVTTLILAFLAAALAGAAAAEPVASVGVRLIRRCQSARDCLRAETVRRMRDEASRIWSSLDVRIEWVDPAAPTSAAAPTDLTVILEESAEPRADWTQRRELVLALIHPPAAACGRGLVRLWATQARRHAAKTNVQGVPFSALPDTLADRLLARSLGRALAHELGHYLLPGVAHRSRGLMRERFSPDELLEPLTKTRYGLGRRDREALLSCGSQRIAPLVASF